MQSTNQSMKQRRLIVAVSLSASFLSVFTQFLLVTAYPRIMTEFGVNASEVQWLTTSYMLALAVLTPLSGYLMDKFKTRQLMIGAMSLFLLGTLFGLFANSFEMLIIGRVTQGISSGIMMPLMQTLLFLIFPREKRGFAMGLAGLVINVAPALGPPISGLMINHFNWRSLYVLVLLTGIVILVCNFLFMRNVTEQREAKIDFLSIFLSTIGFGGTLYGFTMIQGSGVVDGFAIISIVAGLLALSLFVVRQLRLATPILEMRVFQVPVFTLVTIISILSFSLLISLESILPIYVQKAQELSAMQAGLVAAPGALTLAFMSLFAGRLFGKYGGKSITIIGFIFVSVSSIGSYFVQGVRTPLFLTALIFVLSMAGIGLINMPLMTTGINVLPDSLISHGTAIINTARQFGGSIGLTFIMSFIGSATISDKTNAVNYLTGIQHAYFVAFLFSISGLLLSFVLMKAEKMQRGR